MFTNVFANDNANLDNYVYNISNDMYIQVSDNSNVNDCISKLEDELNIGNIEVIEYIDCIDMFRIELATTLTHEIAENILNNSNISFAAPTMLKLATE